jgi:flavin-dependent dehydrogenase
MSRGGVIVVGGGPAGASAAWHLARAGASVTLFDRARFPRDKPCAEYLSPECSRILEHMGVLGACELAGASQLAGMVVRAPGGERASGSFAAAHGFRGFRDRGLALRRTVLDAILLDAARAAGVRVCEEEQVIDLLRDASGAVTGVRTLTDSGAREHLGSLVIGADGLRSVVSRRLGLARFSSVPRRLAFVAHYRGVRGMTAFGEMHAERDGYCGLASVDDGLTNVAIVVPVPVARGAKGRADAFFDEWIAAHPQLAPRFAGAERIAPVRVTGPFAQRARRVTVPGAALVGDAADFFDPFTGEGIYSALRGGELLAPFALASLVARDARSAAAALAPYARARRRAFVGKWVVERMIGLAVGSPALMDRVTGALASRPAMADLLVGVAGDFVPPHTVLSPWFVARLLAGPRSLHAAVEPFSPSP